MEVNGEAAPQADNEASQRESTFHELQQEVHNKRKAGMRYEASVLASCWGNLEWLVFVTEECMPDGCWPKFGVND